MPGTRSKLARRVSMTLARDSKQEESTSSQFYVDWQRPCTKKRQVQTGIPRPLPRNNVRPRKVETSGVKQDENLATQSKEKDKTSVADPTVNVEKNADLIQFSQIKHHTAPRIRNSGRNKVKRTRKVQRTKSEVSTRQIFRYDNGQCKQVSVTNIEYQPKQVHSGTKIEIKVDPPLPKKSPSKPECFSPLGNLESLIDDWDTLFQSNLISSINTRRKKSFKEKKITYQKSGNLPVGRKTVTYQQNNMNYQKTPTRSLISPVPPKCRPHSPSTTPSCLKRIPFEKFEEPVAFDLLDEIIKNEDSSFTKFLPNSRVKFESAIVSPSPKFKKLPSETHRISPETDDSNSLYEDTTTDELNCATFPFYHNQGFFSDMGYSTQSDSTYNSSSELDMMSYTEPGCSPRDSFIDERVCSSPKLKSVPGSSAEKNSVDARKKKQWTKNTTKVGLRNDTVSSRAQVTSSQILSSWTSSENFDPFEDLVDAETQKKYEILIGKKIWELDSKDVNLCVYSLQKNKEVMEGIVGFKRNSSSNQSRKLKKHFTLSP